MPTSVFEPIRSRDLIRDQVFRRLSEAIIAGDLQPLEEIKDIDFQAEFGVSRTPVREAILRLVDLGFLETKAQRYTRVAPVDLRLQIQRAETAAPLICACAVRAVPAFSDAEIAEVSAILERLRQLDASQHGQHEGLDSWYEFYLFIVERAGNDVTLTIVRDQLGPHLRRSVSDHSFPDADALIHPFLDALSARVRARDGQGTASLIEQAIGQIVVAPMRAFLEARRP